MGDLQFAKQFLNTLDNKPTKYQPDHVFDGKTFQLRIPYTLPKLSSPPHPSPPKSQSSPAPAPGSETATPTISIVLKSARNPNMTLTLSSIAPSSTTVQSLKESVQSHLGGPSVVGIDKIKVLLNKKPIPPSKKTVADALEGGLPSGGEGGEVEFGVMIMGGAPDPPPQAAAASTTPTTGASASTGPGSEKAAVEAVDRKPSQPTPMEGVEPTTSSEPVQPGGTSGSAVLDTPEFWDDLQGFLEQRIRDQKEAVRVRGIFETAFKSASSAP